MSFAARFLSVSTAAFLAAGILVSGGAADAQDKKVRIQLASTYPGSMAQLGTLGISLAKKITRASGGSLDMKFNEPGALVPALQVYDSISQGAVDAGWSTPGYWTGKNLAFGWFGSVPFGPNAGEYLAWIYYGGGRQLLEELYGRAKIKTLYCGLIAPEASGWFKKEINSVEDLKGLKMRFFGLGGRVMEKLGVSV
ncbi:MAG: C4-dicarboxylate ABC transporter, partial [Alphaproteobacteria bacterium]|nr:C4-dicarboxylate ABC transporter [Alphaproteobacteria bacterium]